MSNYFNEAGEPLMDGASMRYEMYLDSMYEPDPDSYYDDYDEPEYVDPADCEHGSLDFHSNGEVECRDCDSQVGTWAHRDADGFPIPTFFDQSDHPDANGPEDAGLDSYWEERLTTLYE